MRIPLNALYWCGILKQTNKASDVMSVRSIRHSGHFFPAVKFP